MQSTMNWLKDDDEEEFIQQSSCLLFVAALSLNQRCTVIERKRIDWHAHVAKLVMEGTFLRSYRMDHDSFQRLVNLVRQELSVNEEMSTRRTGAIPIIPEMMMHCLIRYMAGGSYIDVRLVVDISMTSFYKCVHAAMDALTQCKDIKISFPKTTAEIVEQGKQFRNRSSHGVIKRCVGCIDGILIRIKTPSVDECGSVKSFYSGHYAAMGLNVQACCDHLCRFTYVTVAAPGGAHDLGAYTNSTLRDIVESLPVGYYIIGDNAYMPTEHLITPFSGSQREDSINGVYNYYCSQIRIRIEMAFGLLTTKWRIFRSPLQMSLKHLKKVIHSGVILHNYIINCNKSNVDTDEIETLYSEIDTMYIEPEGNQLGYVPSTVSGLQTNKTQSVIRDHIVQYIQNRNLTKPLHNIIRNTT